MKNFCIVFFSKDSIMYRESRMR